MDQPFPSFYLYRAFITVWCLSSDWRLPSWWLIYSTGIFLLGTVSPALRNGEICYKLKGLRLTASPQLSYCWFHLQWATHTATRIIMRWENTGLRSGGRISTPGSALWPVPSPFFDALERRVCLWDALWEPGMHQPLLAMEPVPMVSNQLRSGGAGLYCADQCTCLADPGLEGCARQFTAGWSSPSTAWLRCFRNT